MDAGNLNTVEDKLKPFMTSDASPDKPLYNIKNISINRECKESVRSDQKTPYKTLHDLQFLTENRRENDLARVAKALAKSGFPKIEIEQTITIIDSAPIPSVETLELPEHLAAIIEHASKRERNLSEEVRTWVTLQEGYWNLTEAKQTLQILTKEDKAHLDVIIHRLKKEGIVEKYGKQAGVYRCVDTSIEFMDFANADIQNHVNIRLPLGLHLKTKIFPKGVIVIAGVSGMGKTLFAFNAIAENIGQFPIFYFNSEMGPEALKEKLSHFPISISEWAKHMKVIDQWDFNTIADKIQPDAFNVIDYLEPEGDKPYNIHGVISAIIRRLNKGTALIAIQKKPDAKMGTGGIYSVKAATLAMALDWGKIEIVKNRFREADTLPTLNKINFEVHQGFKFAQQGGWYK